MILFFPLISQSTQWAKLVQLQHLPLLTHGITGSYLRPISQLLDQRLRKSLHTNDWKRFTGAYSSLDWAPRNWPDWMSFPYHVNKFVSHFLDWMGTNKRCYKGIHAFVMDPGTNNKLLFSPPSALCVSYLSEFTHQLTLVSSERCICYTLWNLIWCASSHLPAVPLKESSALVQL